MGKVRVQADSITIGPIEGVSYYTFMVIGNHEADAFSMADCLERHLNDVYDGNQTKPKTNADLILGPNSGEYVKQGIKTKSNMKDNLLPFDLEEAKKDPSRIRAKGFPDDKPKEVRFFSNGCVAIHWDDSNNNFCSYTEKEPDFCLRLTPKRMFVNEYSSGFVRWSDPSDNLEDMLRKKSLIKDYVRTYELIPVKEDE